MLTDKQPFMSRKSLLILIASIAASGLLTWWLWDRFKIRFYFIFIPLIFTGGPLFRRIGRFKKEE